LAPLPQRKRLACSIRWTNGRSISFLPALRAVFEAVKLGLQRRPELFNRLRLHFVGTTYAPDAAGQYQMLPAAIGYTSTVSLEGILGRVVMDLRENLRADRISRHGSTG
jgi:hypothetical protein